jgi:hypothetical protein
MISQRSSLPVFLEIKPVKNEWSITPAAKIAFARAHRDKIKPFAAQD